jgi:hypothetical protein
MTERRVFLGVALLVAALSWPLASDLRPGLDVDGDWRIALQLAVRHGLDFGPGVLFTYGPLGFLHYPVLVDASLARVAFAFTLVVHVGVCVVLLWGLRAALRSLPLAALGTLLVASVIYDGAPIVIGFAAAAALVAGRVEDRRRLLVAGGLGALAAVELLAKLNAGITLLGLAVITVACAPEGRARLGAALAGAFVVVLGAGWVVTGQSLGAFDDYVVGGYGIVSGYSDAMSFVDPEFGAVPGEYAAAIGIAVLGGYAVWSAGTALPWRGRAGLGLLWALLWFTSFKAAFVRPDSLHVNIFFGCTLGALAVLGWSSARRRLPVLLGCVLLLALSLSLSRDTGLPGNFFSPWGRVSSLASQTAMLADGSRTADMIARGRLARRLDARVSDRVLAAVQGKPTHVDPFDAGLAWAYGLRWRPLPVFQTYSAYTRALDERNAAALRDPDGPAAVLRHDPGGVDDRNPDWESPAAMRALLCNFQARASDPLWQAVVRTAPRCGREQPLGAVTARLGSTVRVPAAPDGHSLVLARIDGIGVGGLEKLRAIAFRALTRTVVLDGGRRFRLVPGTAADGLIMSVPRAADFPAPLGLDQHTRTMQVLRGEDAQPGTKIRIRFSAVPIRAAS